MKASEKIKKARIALLLDQPFFGRLVCNLEMQEAPEMPTMATNGKIIKWGPKFVDTLNVRQVTTVLAHEALHCGLLHHLRRGSRHSHAWNIAADRVINCHLEEANKIARAAGKAAPFEWPTDPAPILDMADKGKCAEELYQEPAQRPDGDGSGQGQGQGQNSGMGGVEDAPGAQDSTSNKQQSAEWQQTMLQAAALAKGRGKLPGELARLIEEIVNPRVDWAELLRAFVHEACRDDYAWTRPNARYGPTGFILPGMHSRRLGRILIGVDTSGSIEHAALARFFAECESCMADTRPAGVTILDCDTRVHRVLELEPTDALPREWTGGGGTDFRPVFDFAANMPEPPVCLIFLTDLAGIMPAAEPPFPVVWGVYGTDAQAPFGQTIKID